MGPTWRIPDLGESEIRTGLEEDWAMSTTPEVWRLRPMQGRRRARRPKLQPQNCQELPAESRTAARGSRRSAIGGTLVDGSSILQPVHPPSAPTAQAAGIQVGVKALTLISLAVVLGACGGSFPPPNDQVASTQGAVRAAEEAGADKDPEAELYVKLAREQLDKGREVMTDGQNERADRLLRRAEADADLARGIARSKTAAAEAEEAKKSVEKMTGVDK